jgi:small subunit ribosomal protein S17
MADTTSTAEQTASRRNEKVGQVVSTKMQKTIVVEIEMRKAHPKYKRVMKSNKKFYAHDEQNSARIGDVVRIRETRPLSKLKRWSLEEIIRRSSLSSLPDEAVGGRIGDEVGVASVDFESTKIATGFGRRNKGALEKGL